MSTSPHIDVLEFYTYSHQQIWGDERLALYQIWLNGMKKAKEDPELAVRAKAGEFVPLFWKGGGNKKSKARRLGSHRYLAFWRGLRDEDFDIEPESRPELVCSAYGVKVIFLGDVALFTELSD